MNQAAGTKGSLEVKQEVRDALKAHRRFVILDYVQCTVNNAKVCRDFGVPRSAFYRWRKAYLAGGKAGLLRKKPIARSHPRQIPPEFVDKILHLRSKYHLGPQRITWYLERYHGFTTSCSSVYRTLKRNGVGRLPRSVAAAPSIRAATPRRSPVIRSRSM